MGYFCRQCGRVWGDQGVVLNETRGHCPCGGTLEPLPFRVAEEELRNLPYPVALTARRLAEAVQAGRDVLRCVFLLKDCFEASIRYSGAVLMAAYLRDGAANPPRQQRLLDDMVHPTLGTWVEKVKQLASDLMDGPEPGRTMARLFWQKSAEHNRGKPGETSALKSCREFNEFRNDIIAHGAVRPDEEYAAHLQKWLPQLQAVLLGTAALAPRWQLCLVTAPDCCQVWMGASDFAERQGGFSEPPMNHFVLCGPDEHGKPVDLFPFLCYLPRFKSGHSLYYHDGLKYDCLPRQARLLEFDTGCREESAEPWPGWENRFGKSEVTDACQRWKRRQEDYDWPSLPLPEHDHMVGRRWAITKVDQFLLEHKSGLLLISGEPGRGKTTLWSHLIKSKYQHNDPPPVQFFYRRTDGRTDPHECVRHLYWRLVEIHRQDTGLKRDKHYDLRTMVDHFRQLLQKIESLVSSARRQLIFIDALDEADPATRDKNAYECIPERLPPGVYVIATNRPTKGERMLRARQNADCLDLEHPDLIQVNRSDGEEYVEERLKNTGLPKEVRSEVVRVGAGNFLILKRLCDNVRSGMQPEEVKELLRRLAAPGTDKLAFIFEQDLQRLQERLFGNEYRVACDIVGILAHAHCPLTASVLRRVLQREPDDVERGVGFVTEFLRERPPADPGERDYRIYHEVFKDFLRNHLEGERQRWRELLAKYCLAWRDHPEGFVRNYALRFAVTHLIEAGWREQLETLLKDWEFLEAKAEMVLDAEAEGKMMYDLARDFDRARTLWPEGDFPFLLQLLRQAIYNDLPFLERHPKALFQCLWNRGWWYDCPEAARYYEPPAEGTPLPYQQPGEKLSALLERWRAAKEAKGGFTWLRSLRPPQFPLGTSSHTPLHCDWESVRVLAVSPRDGKRLIFASDFCYGTVILWDVEAGKEKARLEGVLPIGATFDSDNRPVVAVLGDQEINLLRGPNFEEELSFDDEEAAKENPLPDQELRFSDLVFSPDEKYISRIFKSSFGGYFVGIWDAETRKWLKSFLFRDGSIHGLTFARQGGQFAFGSDDGSVLLCEFQPCGEGGSPSARKRRRLTGHEGTVRSVAFSPCGRWIASGGDDGVIRVRSVETDEERVSPLRGHEGTVNCLAFSEDGRILASGGVDRIIRLWQLPKARELPPLCGHEGKVNCLVFLLDGRLASAADDGTVRLWESRWDQEQVAGLPNLTQPEGTIPIAFSPDGQLIATGSQEGVCLWETATGLLRYRLRGHSGVFSPDGQLVATESQDGVFCLWETATGLLRYRLQGHSGDNLTFSPDGQRLAAVEGSLRWTNINKTFSPDGQRLAALSTAYDLYSGGCNREMTIQIWDTQTGRLLDTMQIDKRTLSRDSTTWQWRGATGRLLDTKQIDKRTESLVRKKLADLGLGEIDLPSTSEMTGLWLATSGSREIVIRSRAGEEIAWFPVDFIAPFGIGGQGEEIDWFPIKSPCNPTVHPSGPCWAGESNGHLYLLKLEGADAAQGEPTR